MTNYELVLVEILVGVIMIIIITSSILIGTFSKKKNYEKSSRKK